MADETWTVKELADAFKEFPLDAKVYYEMGPDVPGAIGRVQYVNPWGEMAVLMEPSGKYVRR
jgi:hypothetical protein